MTPGIDTASVEIDDSRCSAVFSCIHIHGKIITYVENAIDLKTCILQRCLYFSHQQQPVGKKAWIG